MEKNDFLMINELILQMYEATSHENMKTDFMKRLRGIIRYDYASIMMAKEEENGIYLADPVCVPRSFLKAEQEYIRTANIDHLDWILYSPETTVVIDSDLLKDRSRLNMPIYQQCYQHYDIFDTMQMSIIYDRHFYGVLTLYRVRESGTFNKEEAFLLRAIGRHLNLCFHMHLDEPQTRDDSVCLEHLTAAYHLSHRESEILGMIFRGMNNYDILEHISITESTLKKHLQNLYHKMGVSSRIDLMKFRS